MKANQYKNVVQGTLDQEEVKKETEALPVVKAALHNLGVAFPQGTYEEVLDTLESGEYMGWIACTAEQAQENANNGVATIGISTETAVVILPDNVDTETVADTAESAMFASSVSDIPTSSNMSMQYYTYSALATTTVVTPREVYPMWECHQTKNDCYKKGKSIGTVKGIVVHSTGANNPNVKRYVEDPERLGVNSNNNHWNQSNIEKMVHAFIGLDKNSEVCIVNTLPYTFACWGVGNGAYGSYNYSPNGHIQFEICEDGLTDRAYFDKAVWGAAVQYCAYLCKSFDLSVDSIVSHKEAHDAGYGSNHGDPDHWLKKFNKTMDDFRTAVKDRL